MTQSITGFAHKASKSKQGGFALAAELTLMSSIMVAGVTVGMTTMRDSLLAEMDDTAEAIGSVQRRRAVRAFGMLLILMLGMASVLFL